MEVSAASGEGVIRIIATTDLVCADDHNGGRNPPACPRLVRESREWKTTQLSSQERMIVPTILLDTSKR